MFKDLQDITFWGTDIVSEVKKPLMESMDSITKGMTEREAMAYKLGVDNALMLIPQLMIVGEKDDIIFYDKNCTMMEEFTMYDLEKRLKHDES